MLPDLSHLSLKEGLVAGPVAEPVAKPEAFLEALLEPPHPTDAKELKAKAKAAKPYDKPKAKAKPKLTIYKQNLDSDKALLIRWPGVGGAAGEVVRTTPLGPLLVDYINVYEPDPNLTKITNSTEAERTWLRVKYGNYWANVDPPDDEDKPLSVTKEMWEYTKAEEVRKAKKFKSELMLQARRALHFEFAPLIQTAVTNLAATMTQDDKSANYGPNGEPKLDWKSEVMPALNAKYSPNWQMSGTIKLTEDQKTSRSNLVKAELRAAKRATFQAALVAAIGVAVDEVKTRMVGDLNAPDDKLKRRGRFLCRHWWNRPGVDGVMRDWSEPDKAMAKRRIEWAKGEVAKADYNFANPPKPPLDLYLENDVKPSNALAFPDPVVIISNAGGEWLWRHMRALLDVAFPSNFDATMGAQFVAFAKQQWSAAFRATQMTKLKAAYTDFVQSIDQMAEIPGAKNVAKSYTAGSGPFNKYLVYQPSDSNPASIPSAGSGAGGVGGNNFYGKIGPPSDLHRLYKLIIRAPLLQERMVVLRSDKSNMGLPHNLGKSTSVEPVIGQGYPIITFLSTTVAPPGNYVGTILGTFYNVDTGCCLMSITIDKGIPILPLVLGSSNLSNYATELEVVLPPGLVLRFAGTSEEPVGTANRTIHHYVATKSGIPVTPVIPSDVDSMPVAIPVTPSDPGLMLVAT